jgi:Cu2+-exporting ATPase
MTALALPAGASGRAAAPAACAHCGQALPAGADARFCCAGCATAYAIVQDLGLGQFYARRAAAAGARALRPDAQEAERDYAAHVRTDGAGRSVLHVMVDGVSCAACVWLIESVLAQEAGLVEGRLNMTTRRLAIRWDGPAAEANRYARRVAALGFRLVPYDPGRLVVAADRAERELLKAMAVAGFAAGNIMLLSVSVWAGHVQGMGQATRDLMHWVSSLIALPAIAYAGRPFFRSALDALKAGRTNMDVPISIGVVLAAAMSLWQTMESGPHAYFDSAVTLLFFLLVGRYLDRRARGRARAAAEQLLSFDTRSLAVVRQDGTAVRVPAEAVRTGDVVLVAAGERVGIDGTVLAGSSDLDASLITGESAPAAARPGTPVFAGTVNLSAPLRIRVTATGERLLLAEIARLMEAAERGRGRFVALADRVARAYAPAVHLLAAATFAGWLALGAAGWEQALTHAIAVLIITCPCALALAVPAVQVVASGRLLRRGILLKSATALERLATVDGVVFDKTGTLTQGDLGLLPDPARPADALRLAASLAQASRHPLARAVARAAPEVPARDDVVEHPGQGLSAAGGAIRLGSRVFCGAGAAGENAGPELWLAAPGMAPVRFAFAERLRPDAAAVVSWLRAQGLPVALLSGDRPGAVAAVARQAGIERWRADCNPADKVRHLTAAGAAGQRLLMVGDGLNDAPALAAAHVSISPATAADISQTAADAVFQGERLAAVAETLAVARRAAGLVRQNLAIALLYNLGAVPLAVAGRVTPLIAAIAMSSSSLLVIANALRLARGGRRAPGDGT